MGKRELVLIVAFVIAGAILYQITAPPPGPNERSFSISRILDGIRREVRGNQAVTDVSTTTRHPITPAVTEIRILGSFAEIVLAGEDRTDIETTMRVNSRAFDEPEAKKLAHETVLLVDPAGSTMSMRIKYPEPGQQRVFLTIKVPARLRVRAEPGGGRTSITNVAALELPGVRGETTIKGVAGRAVVVHRAGQVDIDGVGSLTFTGRGSEATISGVRGETSLRFEQGGELQASELVGPLDVDSRSADLTFSNLERTRGPIRVNAVGGTIVLKGLSAEARIDGRNAELSVALAKPAPVTIYNDGEYIELTPPQGGYHLDALITDGRVTPDNIAKELGIRVEGDEGTREQRLQGAVRGGGDALTVRATRGDLKIVVR